MDSLFRPLFPVVLVLLSCLPNLKIPCYADSNCPSTEPYCVSEFCAQNALGSGGGAAGATGGGTAGATGGGAPDPSSVELLTPVRGALTNDPTPTFSWSADAEATSYTLAYGTSADLSGATLVDGLTATSHTFTFALPSTPRTTYFWAVTPWKAGGVSGVRSAVSSFTLDTQPPTATVTINSGASSTYSEVVQLSLSATDPSGVTQMIVSRDGTFSDAVWETYQTASALDLSADLAQVATATITAHVKFQDLAGNVTNEVSDTIALKRTLVFGPSITAPTTWTLAGSPYLVKSSVTFTAAAPLTIEAGTQVYFAPSMKLDLRGGISAVGTDASPIGLHGALLWLDYAQAWYPTKMPTFNPDGTYASGPRFEHVLMPDGEIEILSYLNVGPGFYMKNCTLGKITGDAIWHLDGTYIEHSTISAMGDQDNDVELVNSKVLNSYVTSWYLCGYEGPVEISHCAIDFLSIDRWTLADDKLEYNRLKQIIWYRPSAYDTAALHDNDIDSNAPVLFTVASDSSPGVAPVDATSNYWGAAATAEMVAGKSNITAIHDSHDDGLLVTVDYSKYLAAPVPDAGPSW